MVKILWYTHIISIWEIQKQEQTAKPNTGSCWSGFASSSVVRNERRDKRDVWPE